MTLRTPNLDLPYIAPAQAQKHVTHNEAIRALDAVVQLSVISIIDAPPSTPVNGERYIVSDNPSGDFEGYEQHIAAFQDGAWVLLKPQIGWQAHEQSQNKILVFTNQAWQHPTMPDTIIESTDRLGINGMADDVNRLLVRSEAVLLDNVGAGHQMKVNKASEPDTASLLFQSAYKGHAEMGLTGDNDFTVKVSPDGNEFIDSMVVERASGDVSFPNGVNRSQLTASTARSGDAAEFYGFPSLSTVSYGQSVLKMNTGRVYFSVFHVDRPTEITGGLAVISKGSSVTGAVLRAAIYEFGDPSGNDWQVGAQRVDFGAQSVDAAQGYELDLSAPTLLEPGWYMFAVGTDGTDVEIRYIQTATPGLFQYAILGSGTGTRFRIVGPSAYGFLDGQSSAIQNGLPADWSGEVADTVTTSTIRGYSFFVPKFKHWNTA